MRTDQMGMADPRAQPVRLDRYSTYMYVGRTMADSKLIGGTVYIFNSATYFIGALDGNVYTSYTGVIEVILNDIEIWDHLVSSDALCPSSYIISDSVIY